MHHNPADLLGLAEPSATRFLRAAGADEAVLRDASDYDRFLALATAMPLCAGMPLAELFQNRLRESTGLPALLCPHTAAAHWDAWVEKHWYKRKFLLPNLPAVCPHCAQPTPTVLRREDVSALEPLPAVQPTDDLATWARRLADEVPARGSVSVSLSADYSFLRPDPYHAGLALHAHATGQAAPDERDLLLTQSVRVIGEAACDRHATLLILGGTPAAMMALADYLTACNRLPDTVWLPELPADVAALSGLYPSLRTGYRVLPDEDAATTEKKRRAYAAHAPIGRAVILTD